MRKYPIFFFVTVLSFFQLAAKKSYDSGFIPNQGQIRDQHGKERPDVLFGCEYKGLIMHIRTGGVSYQLSKAGQRPTEEHSEEPVSRETWRIDEEWLNCNPGFTVEKGASQESWFNYYLKDALIHKLHPLKNFKLIGLYKGIDATYYLAEDAIKYDFIVAPHADHKQIRIRLSGAGIKLQADGSLHLTTPLGTVEEGAPVVFQKGRRLAARWLIQDNVLSFEIPQYDPNAELIIDPPTRIWGTFYGDTGDDHSYHCATDQAGNVYMAGYTESPGTLLATTGAHQVSMAGNADAFLAKFGPNGNRIWATYYGDADHENGMGVAVDQLNNVYLTGSSTSTASAMISTPAAYQTSSAGDSDAFLVKFDPSGQRIWATWYGGPDDDRAYGCTVDPQNNVYISGATNSSLNISSPGAQQAFYKGNADVFLVKFNSAGQRQWATYYGAEQAEEAAGCKSDAAGNVYLYGYVMSNSAMTTSLLVTPGCHQAVYGGVTDAFLAKYNSQGTLLWSTFYGGTMVDAARSCSPDNAGNVYLVGYTYSSNNISSGGFQNIPGGSEDAFICKFNSAGVRQWASYYGGTGFDEAYSSCTDLSGNLVILGFCTTPTSTMIASANAYQATNNGINDGIIAKFDPSGSRIWGTYYGDTGDDRFHCGTYDLQGNLYASGVTGQAGTVVVTSAGHQTVYGGGFRDAMLVRFDDCSNVNPAVSITQKSCDGDSVVISSSNGGAVQWYASSSSTTVIGNGVSYTTPTLSLGTYTYFYQALTCNAASASSVIITVMPLPVISSNSGSICLGQNFNIQASGANHYKFSPGGSVFSPTASSTYTVWGIDANQCINSATATVLVYPLPNAFVSSSGSVICKGDEAVLQAMGNAVGFLWSDGSITNTIAVSPNMNAVYSLTASSVHGCTLLSTYSLQVNPLPVASVKSSDPFICIGEQVTLTVTGNGVSYLWDNGLSTTSVIVSPTVTTVFSVTATGANSCTFMPVYNQQVSPCTGIEALSTSGLSVLPNPFSDKLTVSSITPLRYEFLSSLGQVIGSGELFSAGSKELDLSELAQGIYYLRVETGNRSEVHKIVKMQ